ncbi:MAG: VacJ family lipoprotein [Thermodesulfobacteriota bacterium]|nr:VacJ family lipoprotein [Thermodesulfobacteriota bacterium]
MRALCRLLPLLALWIIASPNLISAEPAMPTQSNVTSNPISQVCAYLQEPIELEPIVPLENIRSPVEPSTLHLAHHLPIIMAQSEEPSIKEESETEERPDTIADPIEPVNRIFFHFNDRLYFWLLKPVATGYKTVVPEDLRIGVQNFFSNVITPIRLVNCLLQANFKGAGNETLRFLLNTTLGLAGFLDPAKKELGIEKRDEDFGQTLGFWGIGPIFYIELPFLGASSLRDTFGYTGDLLLHPQTYLISSVPVKLAVRSYDIINHTSLRIGEYEDFKRAALDPYIAKRDAYHQNRNYKVKERK